MGTEHPFWIESLTAADPFVLPGIFLAANLINIQLHSMRKLTVPQTKLQKAFPWIFRAGIVGVSVFAAFTPSVSSRFKGMIIISNLICKSETRF